LDRSRPPDGDRRKRIRGEIDKKEYEERKRDLGA
jgi:hypothetical protein